MTAPTLSLCMIVGKDESFELERCLKSVQGDLFDEIIIVCTQDDPAIYEIAAKYATQVEKFAWVNDFSIARNKSFEYATSSHIQWLDADDVLTPDNYDKIMRLKPQLNQWDIIMMDYNYAHDAEGNPTTILPRERIVRNTPEIKWNDPIHEHLTIKASFKSLRTEIAIDHYRIKPFNAERNLTLLRKAYKGGGCSPRLSFYFGKDLIENGNIEEAVPVLEEYLNGPTDFNDNKAIACLRLGAVCLNNKDTQAARSYFLRASTYSSAYAEPLFHLGDIAMGEKEWSTAHQYFEEAYSKKMNSAGMSQQSMYYGYLPADRAMVCAYNAGDFQKSLYWVDLCLGYKPDEQRLITNKKNILKEIQKPAPPTEVCTDAKEIRVAWLVPQPNPVAPATRIRRLVVDKKMRDLGYKSSLYSNYLGTPQEFLVEQLKDTQVVIITQYSEYELSLIKTLKSNGIRVIVDICESLFDIPLVLECLKEAHITTCCSTDLAEKAVKWSNAVVIEDPVEEANLREPHSYESTDKPVAMYMGMGGNSFLVTEVYKETIEKAGYKLVVITEWDNADKKWDLQEWPEDLNTADVVLCPQRVDVQPAKSNVKATQAMAMGIPVIASPLRSYKECIDHGKNSYICDTREEWYNALIELRDAAKRREVGLAARDTVGKYSLDNIAEKWGSTLIEVMKSEYGGQAQPAETTVAAPGVREPIALIIPVYNNLEYLKLCLNSIQLNTLYPYFIVLSDSGSDQEMWDYYKTLKGITIVGKQGERRNFSQACNAGIRATNSKYYAILNSDIIVSKGWLTNIQQKMENVPRLAACGVLSNCDRGWLHGAPGVESYPMRLEKSGIELVPGMTKDQMADHYDELYGFMDKSNQDQLNRYVKQDWVAAYATVFARSATDEVGIFDPAFKNGCEDRDLCARLRLFGYEIGQAVDSYIYHFGGISRGAYELEDNTKYHEEDKFNHDLLVKKWEKKNVLIYTGPAWEKWNRDTVDAGMAGSETWAAELGAEFSRRGLKVQILNDCPVDGEVDRDGVIYRRHEKLAEIVEYDHIDYFISSRTCEPLDTWLRCTRPYVMVHDIWLNQDPNYNLRPHRVVKYAGLSEWHLGFLKQHHGIQDDKLMLTSNGINQDLYKDVDKIQKKNQIFYSSSPDRGLLVLLQLFPELRKAVPDLELVVAYGFYNWEESLKQSGNQQGLQHLNAIKALMDQPGVRAVGRVNKTELAQIQMESKAWLYPTWFSETFCCHPENMIMTSSGHKRIVDLSLSDEVLTHKNRFRGINELLSRDYEGDLLQFNIDNATACSSKFTPEHPILMMPAREVYKIKKHKYGEFKDDVMDVEAQWTPAGKIAPGDYIVVPSIDLPGTKQVGTIDILHELSKVSPYYAEVDGRVVSGQGKTSIGVPRRIEITEDFARFCGLYFAEGSASEVTLSLAYHNKESEYIDFSKEFLEFLGFNPTINTQGNCTSVKVQDVTLCRIMGSWFGKGSRNKIVPDFMYNQDRAIVKEFLRGIIDGDGHTASQAMVIELATRKGAMGIKMLMESCGMHPSYHVGYKGLDESRRPYYTISLSRSQWCREYCPEEYMGTKVQNTQFDHAGCSMYRVKEVVHEHYVGKVYNMEVEEDNSYTSDYLAVHNCMSEVEAGLAKGAAVTTPYCGILTTAGDAAVYAWGDEGTPIEQWWQTPEYQKDFIEKSIRVLTDDEYRVECADKMYKQAKKFSWAYAADNWMREWGIDGIAETAPHAEGFIPQRTVASAENKLIQFKPEDFKQKSAPVKPEIATVFDGPRNEQDGYFPLPQPEGIKLNLGCGDKCMRNYINVDLFEAPYVDKQFELDDIPYENGSVAAIYSEHALEHLSIERAAAAVKEWHRVLKAGGELLLRVPDLEECMKAYLAAPSGGDWRQMRSKEWFKYTIFGIQKSQAGEPDEAQFHRTGWSKDEMITLLRDSGFTVEKIGQYPGWGTPSMEILARK